MIEPHLEEPHTAVFNTKIGFKVQSLTLYFHALWCHAPRRGMAV
jgi:hypothetical protein